MHVRASIVQTSRVGTHASLFKLLEQNQNLKWQQKIWALFARIVLAAPDPISNQKTSLSNH